MVTSFVFGSFYDHWLYSTLFEMITCWIYQRNENITRFFLATQIKWNKHREIGPFLLLQQTQKLYGIKSQPGKAALDQIDRLSLSARGPAGKGHMLFQKVRCLSAMQYSTEPSRQPCLHTERHVFLVWANTFTHIAKIQAQVNNVHI